MLFMITKNGLPLDTSENPGFRYFCRRRIPLWTSPSRQTTTRLMELKYEVIKDAVKAELAKLDAICLTYGLSDRKSLRKSIPWHVWPLS